jgi:hypothetical protein
LNQNLPLSTGFFFSVDLSPLSDKRNFQNVGLVWFMVFNATFNNIPVISWRSVLLEEETGGPRENH